MSMQTILKHASTINLESNTSGFRSHFEIQSFYSFSMKLMTANSEII